jgi:hypothetical protein
LQQSLQQDIAVEQQGFAYEGAAMALALLDRLTPWKRDRWRRFRDGPGEPHVYMLHVGAGWAMARLHVRPNRMLQGFDPLLRWLVLDGYGFHQGFFHTRKTAGGQAQPAFLHGYAGRAYDQGLGRSLWFSQCAEPQRIVDRVAGFAADRRSDLWSGVGLAAAYAGGVDEHTLIELLRVARGYEAELGQGCAFAAKARQRAENPVPHTELACRVLLGSSLEAAAARSDAALAVVLGSNKRFESTSSHAAQSTASSERMPAYELWRLQVREQIASQGVKA